MACLRKVVDVAGRAGSVLKSPWSINSHVMKAAFCPFRHSRCERTFDLKSLSFFFFYVGQMLCPWQLLPAVRRGELYVTLCALWVFYNVKLLRIRSWIFAETLQLQLHTNSATCSRGFFPRGIPHKFEADLHLGITFKWAEDDGNRKKDSQENTLPPARTTQSVTPSTLYYFPEIKNHGTLPSSVYRNTTVFQVVTHVKHQ